MLKRLIFHTDRRSLRKFIFNMGIKGAMGLSRYRRRLKRGEFFPAFHFISVTDDCNLNCLGCWVMGKLKNSRMEPGMLDRIITETKSRGSFFFGILGGEPLLYKPLFEVLEKHPDCYFQLFTNGTLLTAAVAEKLRSLGNVSPLISFEGDEQVADVRRGGTDVYNRTMAAVQYATDAGLITGVAVSVCKSNIDFALSEEFILPLIKKGVIYLWYYIYRPVGENATTELCLSADEILRLRLFLVDARSKYDIVIIDAYWDGEGNALCPAASGLSHHINASGYIEPCPVIQFSADHVGQGDLPGIYRQSAFLQDFRSQVPAVTCGCIVMEDPKGLVRFVTEHGAKDTSGRNNEAERLLDMPIVPGHGSVPKIREKSWMYRFAKNRAFFGLGAYG